MPKDVLNSWRITYNNKTSTLEELLRKDELATNQKNLVFTTEEYKVKTGITLKFISETFSLFESS